MDGGKGIRYLYLKKKNFETPASEEDLTISKFIQEWESDNVMGKAT